MICSFYPDGQARVAPHDGVDMAEEMAINPSALFTKCGPWPSHRECGCLRCR